MAQQKTGDQTEKPTEKKLRDSREEGNVHRSEDLTKTALIVLWLILFFLLGPYVYGRIEQATHASFIYIAEPGSAPLIELVYHAAAVLLLAILPFVLVGAAAAALVDFLQVGPLFAPKKVKPKLSNLDPVEGFKKKFSGKNLVEVFKSIAKTTALLVILVIVLFGSLDMMNELPHGTAGDALQAYWHVVMWIGIWLVVVFFFISALDAVYQRHAYIKDLMMSRRDIRQENKDMHGDPQMKNQRQSLHREWGDQNMLASVRQSSVVVANPTHIAVALYYEAGETDLPVVVAKGEDYLAQRIRAEAEAAGVPVMENVALARGLYEDIALDDYISSDFFDAVAEVLHWAENVRAGDGG